jgi:hypothetical protein
MPTSSEKFVVMMQKGFVALTISRRQRGSDLFWVFSLTVLTQSIDRGVQKNRESDSTSIFNTHRFLLHTKNKIVTQWVTRRELLPCGCADDPAAARNNPTEMSTRFVFFFASRAIFFFVLASILCPGGNIIHIKAGCSYHLSAVINHWLFVVSYPVGRK